VRERFSDGEWERLCLLPALIFSLVAGADGRIDDREWKRFHQNLEDSHAHPLLSLVYQELEGLDLPEVMARAATAAQDPRHSQLTRQSLQFRLTPEEYADFMAAVFESGLSIARASGGFLGMGRVSAQEKLALLDFAVVFEVDLDSLG